MTSNDLAAAEVSPSIDPEIVRVLANTDLVQILTDPVALKAFLTVIESIANATLVASPAYLELKLYSPAEAAALLGKTPNWVNEAIVDSRIPYTRIGKSPRLRASHIREIAEAGEVRPFSAAA